MDNPENDLKTLWQDQPTEPTAMSLQAVQQRAAKFQSAMYWRHFVALACVVLLTIELGILVIISNDAIFRAGAFLMTFGAMFVTWYQLRIGGGNRRAVSEASRACLEFHREALRRRRDSLRSAWLWILVPLAPGTTALMWRATQIFPSMPSPACLPYLPHLVYYLDAFAVLALVVYAPLRFHWRARKLDAELKALETGHLS